MSPVAPKGWETAKIREPDSARSGARAAWTRRGVRIAWEWSYCGSCMNFEGRSFVVYEPSLRRPGADDWVSTHETLDAAVVAADEVDRRRSLSPQQRAVEDARRELAKAEALCPR